MKFFSLRKKKYATLTVKENEEPQVFIKREKEKSGITEEVSELWEKCPGCSEIIVKKDIGRNLHKCPNCDYYYRMGARDRIKLLIDGGSFEELDANLESVDFLEFEGYKDKLKSSKKKTNLEEAVVCGIGNIEGIKVSIAVMDFAFLGGSMGSVVGEKITRTIERGAEQKIPVIIVSSSGGARMYEGIVSLMQMAKTSAAIERLNKAGQLFISIPVNPTTGGVTASFAMLGDIIISEPNALIGFAGKRVIEETIKQKLPKGFQSSEFLLEHGMLDMIVKREDMKDVLVKLLRNITQD